MVVVFQKIEGKPLPPNFELKNSKEKLLLISNFEFKYCKEFSFSFYFNNIILNFAQECELYMW